MTRTFNTAVGPQGRHRKENKSQIIPALAVLTLLCGFSTATQYFAHTFQYHATLGRPCELYLPALEDSGVAGELASILPSPVPGCRQRRHDGGSPGFWRS